MFQVQIHTDATKFVKFLVSLLSAFIEQGMFYWFGGEMMVEVRAMYETMQKPDGSVCNNPHVCSFVQNEK
jgi:hypothetical protein